MATAKQVRTEARSSLPHPGRKKHAGKQGKRSAETAEKPRVIRYNPSPDEGLDITQVQQHVAAGAVNYDVDPPSKSVKEIIKSNIFTYFNGVFTIIAVLLILVQSWRDLTFLPIIIANTAIGIVQEIYSKKTLDHLNMVHANRSVVIRDGKQQTIRTSELVLDDIVVFSAGSQICADAVVVDGNVQVNESLLTGESDEITKNIGDTLMSGSYVVSGECRAKLEKVGADSYISKLTIQAKQQNTEEQSEMTRSLNNLVLVFGIIVIPIGIILFWQQFFVVGSDVRTSVTSAVAAILGMIPEGLYLLTSVALAVSAARLALNKVLIHDMKCIETLARVDTLCVDKTGTITMPQMKVSTYLAMDGYREDLMGPLENLIADFAAGQGSDNDTMKAIQEYFHNGDPSHTELAIPFSPEVKYSATVTLGKCYIMGAPEFVLREQYESYREEIDSYSSQGFRVLIFALCPYTPERGQMLEGEVYPLAMLLLANPIRSTAPSTFRYFRKQGVDIKVISGDNPVTVSQVAQQAGIPNAGSYIDASTLKTEKDLRFAATHYTVFGRVTPSQKRDLVVALQDAGRTVAMTGDGVNDILAMKEADCSVAMASGSDAASQAAQLVLLESDFSKMPGIVAEGRRVINNIQRTASLFIVKNIFSLLTSVFSVILVMTFPVEPSQIALISTFTIGIPAFFLALEPNHEPIHGHFMTNVMLKALPGGLTDFLIVCSLVLFCQNFSVDSSDVSTAATLLLAIVGFLILYKISCPMTKFHWTVLLGNMAAMVFCFIFMHDLFAITSISGSCAMLLVLFAVAAEPCLRYLSIAVDKIRELYVKLKHKLRQYRKKDNVPEKE